MTLLSTSSHLIKVGQDYSAGSGISIDDHVISVTGDSGTTYSAGDNISIYEQDEQLYISSKDWTNDIANASANAYNAATAQIPEPQDLSYISSKVDDKLDSTAFTNWQTGQYTTDLQTIEGQITNKLDTSSFSEVSASFLTAINIPESATWNDVSTTVQTNSAQWAEEVISSYTTATLEGINAINSLNGKPLISFRTQSAQEAGIAKYANSAYYDIYGHSLAQNYFDITALSARLTANSGNWNEISAYQNNSATYLTSHQAISADEWNDCYNNVNTNSGAWGGSALPISAGPGIKVNLVDNTLVFSNDETELLASTAASAFTLTESFSSFEQVKIKLRWWDKVPNNYYNVERFTNNKCSLSWTYFDNVSDASPLELAGASWTSNNGIDYNLEAGFARVFATGTDVISNFTHTPYPLSIIGINRK